MNHFIQSGQYFLPLVQSQRTDQVTKAKKENAFMCAALLASRVPWSRRQGLKRPTDCSLSPQLPVTWHLSCWRHSVGVGSRRHAIHSDSLLNASSQENISCAWACCGFLPETSKLQRGKKSVPRADVQSFLALLNWAHSQQKRRA